MMSLSTMRGVAAGLCLVLAGPAAALDDTRQLLSAGNSMGENTTIYTAPGMSNQYQIDFPGTGQGEQAASIRMPAGSLSNLRVSVLTKDNPASGNLRVRVRLDGANTTLTCVVTLSGINTGTCNSTQTVNVPANSKMTFMVANTFTGATTVTWTATVEFN